MFKELTKDNIKDVMTSKVNKFIYFYNGSPENIDLEQLKRVTEHAHKMKNGMDTIPYRIDME